MEALHHYFSSAAFLPHGHCYYWDDYLLWSHALSDGVIALAYLAIPFTLLKIYLKRKRNFPYGWMAVLFAIFILGCGLTHVFDVITLWYPLYYPDSLVRIITAAASTGTAWTLIQITPQLLLMPSANQWKQAQATLEAQVKALEAKDRSLQEVNQQLAYRLEQLQDAQQLAQLGSWYYQPDTGQFSASNTLYTIYELDSLEDSGSTLERFFQREHPQDRQRVHHQVQHCIQTGEAIQIELRLQLPSGAEKVIFSIIQPEKNALGKVVSLRGTSQDITQRKRAEEALRKSEQRFASFFRLNPLPSAITRLSDGKILDANEKALESFGYTYQEALQATTAQLGLWADPAQRDELVDLLNQQAVVQLENTYRHKQGRLWPALTCFEVIELDGETCLLVIIQDISQRKQNEEAMKAYSKELEKLNASKDKFFSIIAHDLMSPVNGVLGAGDILASHLSALTPKEIQQFSQGIFQSASHLKKLLNNLLEWARMQSAELPFIPTRINLHELVEEVFSLLKDSAQEKQLICQSKIPEDLYVLADSNMIQLVVRNLVANAIKFSYPGSSIRLEGQRLKDQVEVKVMDTGVGMSQVVQEKIFRMDTKHSTLGTSGEKGTGLGLLLCKEFIEKHEGSIYVESQEGKGTTFTFLLPDR